MNKYLDRGITVALSVVLSVIIMGCIHRHQMKAAHRRMARMQHMAEMHRPRPMPGMVPQAKGPQNRP